MSTSIIEVKPTYPVGVSVLLTKHNLLLLGRRKQGTAAGLLSTPGGRVEHLDMNVLSTACREFKEETGAELIGPLNELGYRFHHRFGQHYFMFYVWAQHWSGSIENTQPEKCEGWNWYDLSDIRTSDTTEPEDIIWKLTINVRKLGRIV